MKKKYIKTIQDLLELKDTDKKIYESGEDEYYYKFVAGELCRYDNNDDIRFNASILITQDAGYEQYYTLEEDPIEEATEKDVGKLCEFWTDNGGKIIDTLSCVDYECFNPYYAKYNGNWWKHCRVLTEEDFKKIQEGK